MVSGLQKALQQYVQAFGDIAGKHHVPAIGAVEQLRQQLAGVQHRLLRLIGFVIAAAVDVAAAVADIMIHRIRHTGRFGKACTGIVQINPFHGLTLLLPYFLSAYHTFIGKSNFFRGYIYNWYWTFCRLWWYGMISTI